MAGKPGNDCGARPLGVEVRNARSTDPQMLCRVVGWVPAPRYFSIPVLYLCPRVQGSAPCTGPAELLCEHRADVVVSGPAAGASPDLLNLTATSPSAASRSSLVPELHGGLSLSSPSDGPWRPSGSPGTDPDLPLAPTGSEWAGPYIFRHRLGFGGRGKHLISRAAAALHHIKGKAFRWETRCGFRGRPFGKRCAERRLHSRAGDVSRFERILGVLSLTACRNCGMFCGVT